MTAHAHEPTERPRSVSDADRAAVVAQARTELIDLARSQGDMTIEAVDAARFTQEDRKRAEQTFVVAVRSADSGSVERFTMPARRRTARGPDGRAHDREPDAAGPLADGQHPGGVPRATRSAGAT